MGIKEDLSAVKDELNTEEQFLEGLIRAERFYKKYKKPLIAVFVIVVIGFATFSVKTYIDEQNLKKANEAYLSLLQNPSDKQALKTLKEKNIRLYYAYKFQLASKNSDKKMFKEIIDSSKDPYLSDLADYQLSSLEGSEKETASYINESKVGLLKNFALLNEAYLLLKKGKYNDAKIKLSSIPMDSPLKGVAKNLEHYMKK